MYSIEGMGRGHGLFVVVDRPRGIGALSGGRARVSRGL